jgi:hypothetical protein
MKTKKMDPVDGSRLGALVDEYGIATVLATLAKICDGNDREQKKEHEQKDAARELIEREQGVAAMEQRDEKRRKEEEDVRWR